MRVLIYEPMRRPREAEIKNDLEELQKIVDGYIEAVTLSDGVVMICNEEGKCRDDLIPNRPLRNEEGKIVDIICGTFIVCGVSGENFTGLTEEQAHTWKTRFARFI